MAESDDASSSYRCKNCQTPIAFRTDLLSKSFLGKTGPAFLFSHARNIVVGQTQDRQLITGLYSVADIYCSRCGEVLGWKYLRAYEDREKFKEGRLIIERAKIVKQY